MHQHKHNQGVHPLARGPIFMGCGGSKGKDPNAGSGVLPGVSIDNRPFAPDPTSTDVSVIHFPANSETIDIYWYFHESGLTVPSVSPTGQVKIFEDYFQKNLIGNKQNYKISVPQLLKIATLARAQTGVFNSRRFCFERSCTSELHFPPEMVLREQGKRCYCFCT